MSKEIPLSEAEIKILEEHNYNEASSELEPRVEALTQGAAEGFSSELLATQEQRISNNTSGSEEQKYKFVILLSDLIPKIENYFVIDKESSITISTSESTYEQYLEILEGKVDSRTTFIIANHGTSFNNFLLKGTFGILWGKPQSIKNILQKTIVPLVRDKPVEVHITSCYGADDTSVVNTLARGSIILFYTKPGNSTEIKTTFGGIPFLANKRSHYQDSDILDYKRILDTIHVFENDITIAINAEPNASYLEDYTIIASTMDREYTYDELVIISKQNKQKLYDFLSSYKLTDINGTIFPTSFEPSTEEDIRELLTISTLQKLSAPKDKTIENIIKFVRKIPKEFLPTKNIEEYLHLKPEEGLHGILPSIIDIILSNEEDAFYAVGALIDKEINIEDLFFNSSMRLGTASFEVKHFNNFFLTLEKFSFDQEKLKEYVAKFDKNFLTSIYRSNPEDLIKFVEIIKSLNIDLYEFLSKNWIDCSKILDVFAQNNKENPFKTEATKELLKHNINSLVELIVKTTNELESYITENDNYFLFESISKACLEFHLENPYITSGKIIKILEDLINPYYISIEHLSFVDSLNINYSELSREKAQAILNYNISDIRTIKAKVLQHFSTQESESMTLGGEITDSEAIE